MKSLITFLLLTLSFLSKGQIHLQNALDSNWVKLKIEGYSGKSEYKPVDGTGNYYGLCISMTFQNKSDTALDIYVGAGALLLCEDTLVQDMIVTKSFNVFLLEDDKESYLIYAMCGEINDGSPGKGIYYTFGGYADSNVVKTAQYIEEERFQNSLGQFSIWAVRNNVSSDKLRYYGANDEDLNIVASYLHKLNIQCKLTEEFPKVAEKTKESIAKPVEKIVYRDSDTGFKFNYLAWILTGFCMILLVFIFVLIRRK